MPGRCEGRALVLGCHAAACWGTAAWILADLCCAAQIVQFYKEKKLSANLPYKVQFQIPQEDGAKPVKLIAHLVRPEIMRLK